MARKLLPVLLSEHIRTTLAHFFIAVGFLFTMLIVAREKRYTHTLFFHVMWLDANAKKAI